jgi:16S rRNA (guanine966-N2)-methyltransferase
LGLVRVVSGQARGRRLPAALPASVRPTTDRVKESIFDMLGSLGGVEGLEVLDLFCGSGALGIEALSRGAASVRFVDEDQRCLEAAKSNLAAVRLAAARATFQRASLPSWTAPRVDLVLMDPPYGFAELTGVLEALDAEVVVLETGAAPEVPSRWAVHRQRRYGTTLVTVLISPTSEQAT